MDNITVLKNEDQCDCGGVMFVWLVWPAPLSKTIVLEVHVDSLPCYVLVV